MWASERISPTARDDFAQFFILFCAILRAPSSLWESPPSSIKRTTRSGESSKQPNRDRKKGLALKRVNPKRGQPGKKVQMAPEDRPSSNVAQVPLPKRQTADSELPNPAKRILIKKHHILRIDESGKAGLTDNRRSIGLPTCIHCHSKKSGQQTNQ